MPAYRDERTGKWYCKFYYTDWQGHKKQKLKRGFALQRDAKEYERAFLERMQGEPDMPFSSFVELYLEDMAARLKPRTIGEKRGIYERHFKDAFGDLPLNAITPAQIRNWQNSMIAENYSGVYLKHAHSQLSAIFNYAVQFYNLKENPCRKAGGMGKSSAGEMDFWTRDEYNRFIATQEEYPIDKMAFEVLYWTGIRAGELLAITPADIDLSAQTLTISKNLQRVDGEDVIGTPKTTKSRRVISLPAFLCKELEIYMSRLYGLQPEDILFPIGRERLGKSLKAGCAICGVKPIRVHDLRHSHASLLIELGVSPLVIAERLGHESVQITLNTYAHLYPNKQAAVAGQLNALHNPVSN